MADGEPFRLWTERFLKFFLATLEHIMSNKDALENKKVITLTFWIYACNGGDGSVSTLTFSSKEAAEKYAERDDERMEEDIREITLNIDENGKLLDPDPVRDDEDEEELDCEE